MEKILEIRLGDGRVRSGLLPLDAAELLELLLAALAEEGADVEVLKSSNPHLKILGPGSTRAALLVERAKPLRKSVASFAKNARAYRLGKTGREFVDQATAAATTWGFVDLAPAISEKRLGKVLRFDDRYRERLQQKTKAVTISGTDEVYAKVIRAGGETPTVKLELLNGESNTFKVRTKTLAKELGKRLYETVKLRADVTWDRETLEIISLVVTELVTDWKDVHLGDVLETHGGLLPIRSQFDSVEALIASRNEPGG